MPASNLNVTIRPRSEAGGLDLRSRHAPGDTFDFRTLEGVVTGGRDLGLFQVKLPAAFGSGERSWARRGNRWSYRWGYREGVVVAVVVDVAGDYLDLTYTVANETGSVLPQVQIHTCIPTTDAPGYFPEPTVVGGTLGWSELYRRLHVWSGGRRFDFAQTKSGVREPHLSLIRTGGPRTEWGWWRNTDETFDVPVVALSSKDGRSTVSLSFEQSIWASSNTGDNRACFHLFPYFGDIRPGYPSTVRGRLAILPGGPDDALRHHQAFLRTLRR